MASERNRSILVLALLTTAVSAVCWWFGAQLHPIWWLVWLAPLPMLWLTTRVRARWSALAAFVAFTVGNIPEWSYGHTVIGLPITTTLFAILAPSVTIMLAILLYRRLARQSRHLAAAFAVPVLVVAVLFLNALISINGSWGDIGYTQMDALPVIQIAALTGVAGVAFLIMLGPACAAVLCNKSASYPARLRTLVVGGGLIVLALAFGAWRLYDAPSGNGTSVKIGLVARQSSGVLALHSAAGRKLLQRYTDDARELANQGARIVVLPEKIWSSSQLDIPALDALARRKGITLAAGMDYRPPGKRERNVALIFSPQTRKPVVYIKHHLLPFLMPRFQPGHGYTMLDGTPRIGVAICKDMDFPAMGRSYAARGAQLLLVPAWDFGVDGWLHSRMAIMRGVESGFAIARSARDGRLTLSDDRGRVLAMANSAHQDAQLIGTLPLRHTHTLYARWGNWFGWLDVAALVALLGWAWVGGGARKREAKGEPHSAPREPA